MEEIRLKDSYLIDVSIEHKGTLQSFSFTCTISLYFIPLQKYEFNLNTPNISTVFSSNLHKLSPFSIFFAIPMGDRGDRPLHKKTERLIIRGRHPNWRVVAPMHKKKMKSKCHRHLWLSFVKFYFPFIERMVWLEILNTQESPNC